MISRQLAGRGIHDKRVLGAMGSVPREKFLPAAQRRWAYADRALLLSHGQTVSQPYVVAATLQALKLTPDCRVLEVGAGSGYAAAVAALLAKEVVALERIGDLAESARVRLADLGYLNVSVIWTDGTCGYPERSPYDAIFVSAAASNVPAALFEQLAEGGRLVAPVGSSGEHQELAFYLKPEGQATQQAAPEAAHENIRASGQDTNEQTAGAETESAAAKTRGAKGESESAPPRRSQTLFPVAFVPLLPGVKSPGESDPGSSGAASRPAGS